ncbi:hypothetical protein, partial [Lactiplantibacillus plantarum]|uniref:hypothetical protein n=1 Tax=Lactiplantibacillus plantarum TaxID=1590 RepID=UPI001C9E6888
DVYKRQGLNLCPPRSSNWQKCLEVGLGRTSKTSLHQLVSISSGFKLAASEFKGTARFNRG